MSVPSCPLGPCSSEKSAEQMTPWGAVQFHWNEPTGTVSGAGGQNPEAGGLLLHGGGALCRSPAPFQPGRNPTGPSSVPRSAQFVPSSGSVQFVLITPSNHPSLGFPGGSDGKECACNAGDPGSILSSRSSGEGKGNPL